MRTSGLLGVFLCLPLKAINKKWFTFDNTIQFPTNFSLDYLKVFSKCLWICPSFLGCFNIFLTWSYLYAIRVPILPVHLARLKTGKQVFKSLQTSLFKGFYERQFVESHAHLGRVGIVRPGRVEQVCQGRKKVKGPFHEMKMYAKNQEVAACLPAAEEHWSTFVSGATDLTRAVEH